jgi:coenzyme F420-reducing hydrogenase gamma subunit
VKRITIAITGLTACSGCQLTFLNCEEELPLLLDNISIEYFPLACDPSNDIPGLDAALVEGAVSTTADIIMLQRLREKSRILVAYGTCALWGGIAAIKNECNRADLVQSVYGTAPPLKGCFAPTPLHHHVSVDFGIAGCPPEKHEVLQTIAALAHGTVPQLPEYPVCMECRNRELACLLIEEGRACLGPITRAGCRARCPAVSVGCEGCRGPADEANTSEELELLQSRGYSMTKSEGILGRFAPKAERNNGKRHQD